MNDNNRDSQGEIKILDHEPVEGYRPVFIALVIAGVLYLALILAKTL